MVVGVRDEVFQGATDTFAAEQGAGGEAAEDLKNDILREAGQCIPLIGGLLHFVSVQYDESFLGNEITEEENNLTKLHQVVHNSYQSATLTTINNFHGTTSCKFRVAPHRYI